MADAADAAVRRWASGGDNGSSIQTLTACLAREPASFAEHAGLCSGRLFIYISLSLSLLDGIMIKI